MSGNRISVKTLDLNTDFLRIEKQLNVLIDKYFDIDMLIMEKNFK